MWEIYSTDFGVSHSYISPHVEGPRHQGDGIQNAAPFLRIDFCHFGRTNKDSWLYADVTKIRVALLHHNLGSHWIRLGWEATYCD